MNHIYLRIPAVLGALPEVTSLGTEEEIPFTISMPSTYKVFLDIIDKQSVERQAVIIKRIRACNHVSLSEKNKEKMKVSEHPAQNSHLDLLWLLD